MSGWTSKSAKRQRRRSGAATIGVGGSRWQRLVGLRGRVLVMVVSSLSSVGGPHACLTVSSDCGRLHGAVGRSEVFGGRARSCWLLIRADRAPDVNGSLAAAHYCDPCRPRHRGARHAPVTLRARPRATHRPGSTATPPTAPPSWTCSGVLAYGELTAFIRLAVDSDLAPTRRTRRRWPAWRSPSTSTTGADAHLRRDGRRPGGGDGAVRRARSTPSTSAPGPRLARGAGQGLRRRRHRQGLLPRDVGLRRRRDPGRWCARCSTTPGRPSSWSGACARPSRPTADRRPAGPVGPAAGRRGAVAGAGRGGRARRAVGAARRRAGGADLAEVGRMFARLTDKHTRRMARLGLSA